jgi:hypothetical protein
MKYSPTVGWDANSAGSQSAPPDGIHLDLSGASLGKPALIRTRPAETPPFHGRSRCKCTQEVSRSSPRAWSGVDFNRLLDCHFLGFRREVHIRAYPLSGFHLGEPVASRGVYHRSGRHVRHAGRACLSKTNVGDQDWPGSELPFSDREWPVGFGSWSQSRSAHPPAPCLGCHHLAGPQRDFRCETTEEGRRSADNSATHCQNVIASPSARHEAQFPTYPAWALTARPQRSPRPPCCTYVAGACGMEWDRTGRYGTRRDNDSKSSRAVTR